MLKPATMTLLTGGKSTSGTTSGSAIGKPIERPTNARTFDEARFVVGKKGKSGAEMIVLQFKIHEGYAAEAEKWLKSGRVPAYEVMSDLLRHALVEHLREFLPSVAGQIEGSLLHEMAQVDELTASWEFQNKFTKQIEWMAEQVNATLQMPGGRREVERKLRAIRRHIDATRPSFFRSVYAKMFNDRFGAYIGKIALLSYDESAEGQDDGTLELPDLIERWGRAGDEDEGEEESGE